MDPPPQKTYKRATILQKIRVILDNSDQFTPPQLALIIKCKDKRVVNADEIAIIWQLAAQIKKDGVNNKPKIEYWTFCLTEYHNPQYPCHPIHLEPYMPDGSIVWICPALFQLTKKFKNKKNGEE